MTTDPNDWRVQFGPDGRRTIAHVELDYFSIDRDGRLYWKGQQVILEQKISLRGFELSLAIAVAVAAVVQAAVAVAAWLWPTAPT
jgi:hypothetical protein